jgi:hypothetical protein
VVGAAACGGTEAETAATPAVRTVPVRTATVQTRDISETLTLTGTLDPRAQVTVVSEVSARLERVLKNEGDRVSKGELLAVLDDTDFRLARDRARAMLAVAEANRAHARAENERADSLLKTGGITDKDRLSAQVAVQVAEASYSQASSELAITERQIGRSDRRAALGPRGGRARTLELLAWGPEPHPTSSMTRRSTSALGRLRRPEAAPRREGHCHGGCASRVRDRGGSTGSPQIERGAGRLASSSCRGRSGVGLFARGGSRATFQVVSWCCPRRWCATADPATRRRSWWSAAKQSAAMSPSAWKWPMPFR